MPENYNPDQTSHNDAPLRTEDLGNVIRVYGPYDIINPSPPIVYYTKDGEDTGIRYSIGADRNTGEMKIYYVEYPKDVYGSAEELANSPYAKKFFSRCNVCAAIDRLRHTAASSTSAPSYQPAPAYPPNYPSPPAYPPSYQSPPAYQIPPSYPVQPVSQQRVSLGPVLPRYFPALSQLLLGIAGDIYLSKFGKTLTTMLLSIVCDAMSGFANSDTTRRALMSFSDELAESVLQETNNKEFTDALRNDMMRLSKAIDEDRNFIDAVLVAIKSEKSTRDDTKKKRSPAPVRLADIRSRPFID